MKLSELVKQLGDAVGPAFDVLHQRQKSPQADLTELQQRVDRLEAQKDDE